MNMFAAVPAILLLALLVIYPFYFIVGAGRARRQKRRGPSIITLTLWLVVVLLLVAVVVPKFLHFASQSRQSEARTNLAAISTTQIVYHLENQRYAETFAELGWTSDEPRHYAYFCGRDLLANTSGDPVVQRPDGDWPLPVKPMAGPSHFVCLAMGNLDNDPFMDVWAVNDKKQIENLRNDITNRDARDPDPRTWTLYMLGGALALFVLLIGVDVVRIRKGKRAGEAEPGPGTGSGETK